MSSTVRNAVVVIAVVVGGAALYWLRGILTPLMLALVLLIMVDGLERGVRRVAPKIPERFALPAALLLIVVGFVAAVWVLVDGMTNFATEFSGVHERVDAVIADVAGLFGVQVAPTVDQLLNKVNFQQYIGDVANSVQGVASDGFFVLIYLGFLMASRRGFAQKAKGLFRKPEDWAEADAVFRRIRDGAEAYLWVQTLTGAMIAGGSWIAMVAVGLHNAGFWAFVIFLVNYIPIIGAMIGGLAPPLFALVQFDTYWQAVVLLVALQLIMFVVGNIIYPRMQAKSQNIDPVVVLLSFAFWGGLWGMTGAFLSTPLTTIMIVILAEFRGSRWIAVLLSGDGKPYPLPPVDAAGRPRPGSSI